MAFGPNVQEDGERYDNILEVFGGEENGEARESVAAKEHFSSDQSFKVICDVPCKGDKGAKDDKNSSSLFDLHYFEELETNNSHNSKESESGKRKGDTDANIFQDKTERSFVTIDVRLDPGHGTENLIQVDSTTRHSKESTSTTARDKVTEKEEEQDLSAIPSKLL